MPSSREDTGRAPNVVGSAKVPSSVVESGGR
jgi:hypothetical protein